MANHPKRIFDHLRDRVMDRIGYDRTLTPTIPPLHDLTTTEWCPAFEAALRSYPSPTATWVKEEFFTLMRNRLLLGAFRYGLFQAKSTNNWNYFEGMYIRLNRYLETGNTEWLVDVANFCLCVTKQDDPQPWAHDVQNLSSWNHPTATHLLSLLNRAKLAPGTDRCSVHRLAAACWFEFSRPSHPTAHFAAVETGLHTAPNPNCSYS